MKTSFIVIAYNEAHGIEATLRAIVAQQGLSSFEVVVVNDGSTDDTLAITRRLSREFPVIRIVDQPNQGRGAARAAGVKAARGTYLAFIDADIVLPKNWLKRCMAKMQQYDACGGIAVPDGDATYVYRVCKLKPKVAPQSTTITGNNGLFKRSVFTKVSYNPTKKNGEDVALGYAMTAAGLRATTIPALVVDHREAKSYQKSLAWLFESGIGASRQLYEQKQIRVPDIAWVGFVGLAVLAVAALLGTGLPWLLPATALLGYVTLSAFMHLKSKFHLGLNWRSLFALAINDTLLLAYYVGRTVGAITERRYRRG